MKKNFFVIFYYLIRNVIGSYILYPENVSFSVAVQICDSINATIVFINNSTEDAFIKNTYLNHASVTLGIWLAIYDFIGNETNVNYYTNQTLSFTNWNPGQPDTLTDYCVRYDKNFQKWADMTCSISYSVLCESNKIFNELSSAYEKTTVTTKDVTITINATITTTTHTSTTTTTTSATTTPTTTTKTDYITSRTTDFISMTTIKSLSKNSTENIKTDSATAIIHSTDRSMNIHFWYEWNPWSLCQLNRQRKNTNMTNGIEYQILNISCSCISEYLFFKR